MDCESRFDAGLSPLRWVVPFLVFSAGCRPTLGHDVVLSISCGQLGLSAPTLEITLDSTSARASGRLTLGPLPVDTATLEGTVVSLHAEGAMVQCQSKLGKFHIVIRGTTPVDGALQIAAHRSVDIVVRTADGAQRFAGAFDPRVAGPTELAWTVGGH